MSHRIAATGVCGAVALVVSGLGAQTGPILEGRPLSAWVRDLKYGAWFEAKRAAEVVVRLGPDAKPALPGLILALKKKEARLAAIRAIGEIGPQAKAATSKVKYYRKSRRPEMRDAVFRALDSMGVNIVKILTRDLQDPDVRTGSILRLGGLGRGALPAVKNLVGILGYVVKPLRPGLHRADVRQRHKARTVAAVRNRRAAAVALGAIGDGSWKTVQALAARLEDPDAEVRKLSVLALAQQGEEAVPKLARALRLEEDRIVSAVVLILAKLGPDAKPALKELRKVARGTRRPLARKHAGPAILAIEGSLGLLAQAASQDGKERAKAVAALAPFGDCAAPVIEEVLGGADADLKLVALDALLAKQAWLRPPGRYSLANPPPPRMPLDRLLAALLKACKDGDKRVAARAARAIGRLGRRAAGAASTLAHCIGDQDRTLRIAAIDALSGMGTAAGIAIPQLVDALRDPAVKERAIPVLGRIGRNAVPALLTALGDQSDGVRVSAVRALEAIGPPAWKAVAPLRALADGEGTLQLVAARALERIEPQK